MAAKNVAMLTPVIADRLNSYLADYDQRGREFLYKGFSTGFHIPYYGNVFHVFQVIKFWPLIIQLSYNKT